MALVKTIHEVAREQLNRAADEASSRFVDAVRPIYGATEQGRPEHIGTCFFMSLDGRDYMLTAAHILDENRKTNMYVGVNGRPVLLTGTFHATAPPNGIRADDHYDFGWQPMDAWDSAENGALRTVPFEVFDMSLAGNDNAYFLALGYPNSKNKKHDHQKKSVVPVYMKYSAKAKPMPDLCLKLGVSIESHIFLPHDRKLSRDEHGAIVNSLAPRGSSGGALINLGAVTSVETLLPGCKLQPKLAGMLIENQKHSKALVAVRLPVIIEKIRQHGAAHP